MKKALTDADTQAIILGIDLLISQNRQQALEAEEIAKDTYTAEWRRQEAHREAQWRWEEDRTLKELYEALHAGKLSLDLPQSV